MRPARTDRRAASGLALMTLLGTLALAGCSAEQDELREWMEQQRREVKPSVTPLEAPKQFHQSWFNGFLDPRKMN